MNVARISPDGKYLAGGSGHNTFLKVYAINRDTLDASELATGDFHLLPINDIAWSPCGYYIATGGEDCVVVIWHLQINEAKQKVQLEPRRVFRGHVAAVTTISFNFKGTLLASGSVDEKIIVWNVKGGTLLKLLNAHSRPIVSVDFSFDSKMLLTASHDGYLRVWSLIDGMALRIISGADELLPIRSAKFSPNAAYALVSYTDGVTRLLDLANKNVVKQFGKPSTHEYTGTVSVHDPETGESETGLETATSGAVSTTSKQNEFYLDLYSRELAFCRPNNVLVGTSQGIAVYDIRTQELVKMITDTPTLCIDTNEPLRIGLGAGPTGLKIFKLDFN